MKKILFIIIISLLAITSLSAFGKKEESKAAETLSNSTETPKEFNNITNEEVEITGLVEKGFKNRICIIENPESKSRISYYPDEKASKKLEKLLGQSVTVTAKVKGTNNPFKKEIEISEIN